METTAESIRRLSVPDYVVFVVSVLASLSVGIYYVYKDRTKRTLESYLMADRDISVWPVALSLVMSCVSPLSMMLDPVEAFSYGNAYFGRWYIH